MHNLLLAGGKGVGTIASLLGVKTKMAKLNLSGQVENKDSFTVVWKRKTAAKASHGGALLILGASEAELPTVFGCNKDSLPPFTITPRSAPLTGTVIDCTGVNSFLQRTAGLTALSDAFTLLQSLNPSSKQPMAPVWLLATQTLPTGGAVATMKSLEYSGIWGLVRTARAEMPTSLRIGCIEKAEGLNTDLLKSTSLASLGADPNVADEPELISTAASEWRLPQLIKTAPFNDGSLRMQLDSLGSIGNIYLEPMTLDDLTLGGSEVAVKVHAVGLNFRDVLMVLGAYPDAHGLPGDDSTSTVITSNPQATHLKEGERVFGLAIEPLANVARAISLHLTPCPKALTSEEACTLPTVWSTVHVAVGWQRTQCYHYALQHAAAGGVGLVGIDYLQWLGAKVLGTAGKPQKHAILHGLRVTSLASRDGTAHAFGLIKSLGSKRLHYVLNSLSSDFISASLASCAESGGFAEIGKRGVWSDERQSASSVLLGFSGVAAGRTRYRAIAIDRDWVSTPPWFQRVIKVLSKRADTAVARSLPLQTVGMEHELERAFRILQAGANLGKVVVRVAKRDMSLPQPGIPGTEIITGGTGGLGMLYCALAGATRHEHDRRRIAQRKDGQRRAKRAGPAYGEPCKR